MLPKIFLVFLIPLLFLFFAVKTLPDYGVNWDEVQHFNRGQAYWYYFLTSKTNYLDLPRHNTLDEAIDFKDIRGRYARIFLDAKRSKKIEPDYRRSYFQSDVFNFEYFKDNDSGHPPANGILAAATNYFFYYKLGVTGDLYAYHLFEVLTAFLIVLSVSVLAYRLCGVFPAFVAGASLSLYPLFFSESHFNIKDPVLSSFFGVTIILFYFGITVKKKLLILASAIFAGLSLGTKFNAIFLPVIILPWLILYWWRVGKFKINRRMVAIFIIYPLIVGGVFFLLWPYLWYSGWEGLVNIFKYYSSEGIGSNPALEKFNIAGFNMFPVFWIVITTPLPILTFFLLGGFWVIKNLFKNKDHTSLLLLLWFAVPVLRVTMPSSVIYGGVRHIMEFVPALALIAGTGSYFLLSAINKRFRALTRAVMLFILVFVVMEMVWIHPNQNVYFNQFIGGLKGAYARGVPYTGNSFGNAYQQGIVWLNENAEYGAKLGLAIGGTVNLPRENMRSDINLSNDNFSAFLQEGEYEMEMSHNGVTKDYFAYAYLDKFVDPVYELNVDGVAILKIWKNDRAHIRNGFKEQTVYKISQALVEENVLIVDIGNKIYLTGLYIDYDRTNCRDSISGYISTSKDAITWKQESDPISYPQISPAKIDSKFKDFFFLFPAKESRYVKVVLDDKERCLLNDPKIEVSGLKQ